MRVSTASKEKFGQGNNRGARRADVLPSPGIGGAGSWGQDSGLPEWLFQSDGRRARKHVLAPWTSFAPERVVGRVLGDCAAEIGFGAEVTGRSEDIQREIVPFRAFERVVAFVSDVGEARTA